MYKNNHDDCSEFKFMQKMRIKLPSITTRLLCVAISLLMLPMQLNSEQGNYFENEACEYSEGEVHAGGANHEAAGSFFMRLGSAFSEKFPAIFACKITEPQAKYGKVFISKTGRIPPHSSDSMTVFLTDGANCQPGVAMTIATLPPESVIGKIDEEGSPTVNVQQLRVSHAIGDPSAQVVCILVYCMNEMTECDFKADVAFYDTYGKPVPILGVVFGLGWGDTILLILVSVELIALAVYCLGVFARYAPVLKAEQEEANTAKQKDQKQWFT